MNVLVTGGVGFIGSHVCERLLDAGHTVCALDDLNDFYDPALKQNTLRKLQARAAHPSWSYGGTSVSPPCTYAASLTGHESLRPCDP